jgi:hypothetical protein
LHASEFHGLLFGAINRKSDGSFCKVTLLLRLHSTEDHLTEDAHISKFHYPTSFRNSTENGVTAASASEGPSTILLLLTVESSQSRIWDVTLNERIFIASFVRIGHWLRPVAENTQTLNLVTLKANSWRTFLSTEEKTTATW